MFEGGSSPFSSSYHLIIFCNSSNFSNFPTLPANPGRGLQNYLCFHDSFEWYDVLIDVATTEANFFLGGTNMSQIASVSGPAIAVNTEMERHREDQHHWPFYSMYKRGVIGKGIGLARTAIAESSDDEFALGQFCQFHTTYAANSLGLFQSMGASRVNSTGDYTSEFYRLHDYELESGRSESMHQELVTITRQNMFIPKGDEVRAPKK